MAGFHGKGYLKLEATRLKKDSSFGLALRTLQSNALVLLANGMVQKVTDGKNFEKEISNDIETRVRFGLLAKLFLYKFHNLLSCTCFNCSCLEKKEGEKVIIRYHWWTEEPR